MQPAARAIYIYSLSSVVITIILCRRVYTNIRGVETRVIGLFFFLLDCRFSSLFETCQSLFWASFGGVGIDSFELTGKYILV